MHALKQFREQRKISQAAIARAAGVTQSMVPYWESGAKPITPERAVALERNLGIPAEALNSTIAEFVSLQKKRTPTENEDEHGRSGNDAN